MSARTASVSGGGKAVRQSGIELLRIFAMLGIIAYHFANYCGFYGLNEIVSRPREAFFAGICGFGKFGVAAFFIITGYFLCARKTPPQVKRVWPIVRQALFYALVSLALCLVFFRGEMPLSFPLPNLWKEHLQIFFNGDYWFIGAYILLMIIAPQLKKMFDALDNKSLTRLCLIVTLVAVFSCDFLALTRLGKGNEGMNSFMFPTAFVYTLIGYTIRRRENEIRNCGWATAALIVGVLLIMVSPVVHAFYYHNNLGSLDVFRGEHAIGTLLASVGAFIICSRMKWSNRFVNYAASHTLAVYLIHNSPIVLYSTVWAGSFAVRLIDTLYNRSFAVSLGVFAALLLGTFAACCIIEIIRRLAVRVIVKICTIEKEAAQK